MKKKVTKRAYIKPESKVYPLAVESLLHVGSGQHEHIGQGGTLGNAKRNTDRWTWEDEDEDKDEASLVMGDE